MPPVPDSPDQTSLLLPTVDTPAPLFCKAYIDTLFMPHAGGYRYITQARCSLTAWPEWRALRVETGCTIGAFIFEEILCRWGAVQEIVTDNGMAYIAALNWLADRYRICHICISAYNSRANGIIERQHRTIQDLLVKACEGDPSRWPTVTPFVFWANHAMTCKSTRHSPFYMAHGIEPILPFDITQAMFLIPNLTEPVSTNDLLATRARQLEKHPANLAAIRERIHTSQHASVRQFKKQYAHTICDYDFALGALVLVHSTGSDMDKTRLCYCSPMVVLRCTCNGAYRLSELDGSISKLCYAAFRLLPYHLRSPSLITVTRLVTSKDLASLERDDTPLSGRANDDDEDTLTWEGQILNPRGGVRPALRAALESETAEAHRVEHV